MAPKTINDAVLAEKIQYRREELDLSIEEAARAANVSARTWSRYESGEGIREDKIKNICRALHWRKLPTSDDYQKLVNTSDSIEAVLDKEKKQTGKAWPALIENKYGPLPALLFKLGSDSLIFELNRCIQEMKIMPGDTHINQISYLGEYLPQQYLLRYNYEFLYSLLTAVKSLVRRASGKEFLCYSVMEEIALFLIIEIEGYDILQDHDNLRDATFYTDNYDRKEWIYDVIGEQDFLEILYDEMYGILDESSEYHFKHWNDKQFWCPHTTGDYLNKNEEDDNNED